MMMVDNNNIKGNRSRIRITEHGSLKLYNCFIDETLNLPVRNIARFAHRLTFHRRLFTFLDLQGRLQLTLYLPSRSWLPLVSGF